MKSQVPPKIWNSTTVSKIDNKSAYIMISEDHMTLKTEVMQIWSKE